MKSQPHPVRRLIAFAFPLLFGAICFYLGVSVAPTLENARDGAYVSKLRSIISGLVAHPEILQPYRLQLSNRWTKLNPEETKSVLLEISKRHQLDGEALDFDEHGNPQVACEISLRLVNDQLEVFIERPNRTRLYLGALDH